MWWIQLPTMIVRQFAAIFTLMLQLSSGQTLMMTCVISWLEKFYHPFCYLPYVYMHFCYVKGSILVGIQGGTGKQMLLPMEMYYNIICAFIMERDVPDALVQTPRHHLALEASSIARFGNPFNEIAHEAATKSCGLKVNRMPSLTHPSDSGQAFCLLWRRESWWRDEDRAMAYSHQAVLVGLKAALAGPVVLPNSFACLLRVNE